MSQFLPTGGFKWVWNLKQNHLALKHGDILNLNDEGDTGYFFKVDLQYAEYLHKTHDQFPLAPQHLKIEENLLSSYQKELGENLGVKFGGEKLCLTLNDKKDYICHFRNLKFYIQQGMKHKKIHKILEFNQSAWLKPYGLPFGSCGSGKYNLSQLYSF